jgi:hypothetical protein
MGNKRLIVAKTNYVTPLNQKGKVFRMSAWQGQKWFGFLY